MSVDEVSSLLLEERLLARAEGRPAVTLDDLSYQPNEDNEKLWLEFQHPEIDEEDPLPESQEERDWLDQCNYAGPFPNLRTVSALVRSAPSSLRSSPAFAFLIRRQKWLRQILAELSLEWEYGARHDQAEVLHHPALDDEPDVSTHRLTNFEM